MLFFSGFLMINVFLLLKGLSRSSLLLFFLYCTLNTWSKSLVPNQSTKHNALSHIDVNSAFYEQLIIGSSNPLTMSEMTNIRGSASKLKRVYPHEDDFIGDVATHYFRPLLVDEAKVIGRFFVSANAHQQQSI